MTYRVQKVDGSEFRASDIATRHSATVTIRMTIVNCVRFALVANWDRHIRPFCDVSTEKGKNHLDMSTENEAVPNGLSISATGALDLWRRFGDYLLLASSLPSLLKSSICYAHVVATTSHIHLPFKLDVRHDGFS